MKKILAILFFVALAVPSRAAITITIEEVGLDVVFTATGTANIDSFGAPLSAGGSAGVDANRPYLFVGTTNSIDVDIYGGLTTEPIGPGPTSPIAADAATGDGFGFNFSSLLLYQGYVSNTPLSGTATFFNHSFSSLGIAEGTYTYTWGSGGNFDQATIIVVPEPSTYGALTGLVILGLVIIRRKRS